MRLFKSRPIAKGGAEPANPPPPPTSRAVPPPPPRPAPPKAGRSTRRSTGFPYTTPSGHTYKRPGTVAELGRYYMDWYQAKCENWDFEEWPPYPDDEVFGRALTCDVELLERVTKALAMVVGEVDDPGAEVWGVLYEANERIGRCYGLPDVPVTDEMAGMSVDEFKTAYLAALAGPVENRDPRLPVDAVRCDRCNGWHTARHPHVAPRRPLYDGPVWDHAVPKPQMLELWVAAGGDAVSFESTMAEAGGPAGMWAHIVQVLDAWIALGRACRFPMPTPVVGVRAVTDTER